MSRKSSNKKIAAASWYHCETCNVDITSKEHETHEKVCPIAEGQAGEYVRDGKLFTEVQRRTFNVEPLSDMPSKYVNNLIFISASAMRLAHFHIGQQVAVTAVDAEKPASLFRTVWPIPEKFQTSVFVSEEDSQLNWAHILGTTVKIEVLSNAGGATPANVVHLRMTNPSSLELNDRQLRDIEGNLKIELRHLIFTQNSCIKTNFFNKPLEFFVTGWTHFIDDHSNVSSLEKAFEKLDLRNDDSCFKITHATRIEIERLPSSSNDENNTDVVYKVTEADIGGLNKQIKLIEDAMDVAFGFQNIPKGVKISRGLLLYGPHGCGKSLLSDVMCTIIQQKSIALANSKAYIVKINTSELFSRFLGETEKNLAAYFEKAYSYYPHPTLIIIEDVHNLCPKHETNDVVKRVSVAFSSLLDTLSSKRTDVQKIFVLATTSQIDALNPNVRRCGRLDCEVEIGVPTPKQRADILNCLLHNVDHNLTSEQIENVAQVTHGFVGADLANLIYSASVRASKSGSLNLNLTDVQDSLTYVKPSSMREILIENPNVRWSDIGGQDELKLKLKQAIEWPLLHPEKFKRLGIKPPRGILMFGPPGCSKTMIAKALATESQLNFLSIKGPELFSMWVGESERAVREVFRKARQVAPAIVFFDEIDAIGGERADGSAGGSGASVKERVLTQLLTELDGVEALDNVTIVAATNRPDMIDKALLRPGRIDRIVYVGLPDAVARREIFRIKLKAMPLHDDVELEELVNSTEGYSGAEIQAVCNEAALKTLERSFEAEFVASCDFEYALKAVQPRTSADLLRLYEDYMHTK